LNLEPDWLNDGAKAFLPGEDKDRIGVYEGQHLSVAAASPQHLLAMKLMASRVERDQDDIRELYKLCGLTTAAQGLDLLESYCPERQILPRDQFLLQKCFQRRKKKDATPVCRASNLVRTCKPSLLQVERIGRNANHRTA
jgi:hypothetical protein